MAELKAARPRRALGWLLLSLSLGASGCEGCSCQGDRLVTFGLDAGARPGQSAPVANVPGVSGPDAGVGAVAGVRARALPAGTRRVELSGHPLQRDDGDLRAILMVDVDADGDQDAYVLHTRGAAPAAGAAAPAAGSPASAPTVVLSLARVAPGGVTLAELGHTLAPADCELSEGSGETLGPTLVVLSAAFTCATGPASVALIASLEAQPRLEERLTLLAPAPAASTDTPEPDAAAATPASPSAPLPGATTPDPSALPLGLALRAEDKNQDGTPDLVARVSLGEGDDAVSVDLAWIEGASGLARDRAEPEATLRTLANAAADPLTRQPEVALRSALRVLALYTALCAEGGAERVRLGDAQGLPCGRSRGAGKAAAVVAAAHAQAGDVFAAAQALARLDSSALTVSEAERRMVTRAYGRAPTPRGLVMRKLADVTGRGGLSFLDDQHVQLPGGRVMSIREPVPTAAPPPAASPEDGGVAATGNQATTSPGGVPTSNLPPPRLNAGLVVDPSGRFRTSRVGRSCAAYVVELSALDPILHGPPRLAVIAALPTPRCAAGAPGAIEAAEDGGFVPLGWAPQGLLLARRDELWVVPLTDEARPAGEPFRVATGTLPPAPVNGPAIQRDGSRYVTTLDAGVVLHTLGPEPSLTLLRPPGWGEVSGDTAVRGVALAPGGNAVVVQRGAAVYLLTW
ncbi:MAG: hypothetical protein IPG17_00195 [Sandaracinaceae bacterium]|nr:hypothetical protein [Sandaracinaceae bacterium]